MSTVRIRKFLLVVCVAITCAVISIGLGRAEVGAFYGGPGAGTPTPYVLGAILDEPDPYTNYWVQEHVGLGPHRVLNPNGETNGDGRPDVWLHPGTRVPLVVWSRNSPTGFDIVLSRFEDGAWTDPDVLVDVVENARDPRLAIDAATGDVHLVYWIEAVEPRAEHRVAPADLSTWSAPQAVSGPGEASFRPQAVVHDGVLRVIYEVHVPGAGGTPRQVVLARLDPGGFVQEIVAQTTHDGDICPEVHSQAGRIWLDWIDGEGLMGWIRFDPLEGTWTPILAEPFAGVEEREFHVRGAVRAKAIE